MTLYIKNISYSVTEDRLQRAFGRYGECHIDLKRGFAFAEYVDKRDAEEALDKLQGTNFSGMNVKIKVSDCGTMPRLQLFCFGNQTD